MRNALVFLLTRCGDVARALCLCFLASCTPQLIGSSGSGSTTLSGMAYSIPSGLYQRNSAVPTNTPSFTTGTATSYSISTALPAGMSFSTTTGQITGTPTADTPGAATPVFTNYTVTASNAVSSTTAIVKLLVMNGFVVDSTAWDGTAATSDAVAGNSICATPTATCTLKAAIEEVNALGGVRSIYLNDGTYVPTSSVAPVGLTHLVLCGRTADTAIISGNNAIKVINANGGGGANMTLCNITIRDGFQNANGGAGLGFTSASATANINLSYVKFINNNNASAGFGAIGGMGIDMANAGGVINIDHSLFDTNTTLGTGGAIFHNTLGTINITNSTFQNNSGGTGAGALYNWTGGTFNITNTTFINNTSVGGSAILIAGTGILRVLNSTFYGNTATAGAGAAIAFTSSGTSDVRFSTFYNNTASVAGGAISTTSGGPTLTTTANVFQGNIGGGAPSHCANSSGTWNGGGYSVFGSTGGTCGSAGTGDVSTASPGLNTTGAYNGGDVLNLSLNAGSSAIDLIPAAACLDRLGASLTTDTRNSIRPSGTKCDAGAVEN